MGNRNSIVVPEELRLVLVGNTGSGKSASGNTILNCKKFQSKPSASSVTRTCEKQSAELVLDGGQKKTRVVVADVPGFGDTHLSADQTLEKIAESVKLSAPGPHAFLLVLPIGRYTSEQNQAVNNVAKIFGEQAVTKHTVVLFTRGDELEGMSIKQYLKDAPAELKNLITRCGKRYHVFNNKDPGNVAQVEELLMKVMEMVKQTESGFYTNAMFKEAQSILAGEGTPKEKLERLKSMLLCGTVGLALGVVFGLAVSVGIAGSTCLAGAAVITTAATKATALTAGAALGGVVCGAVGVGIGGCNGVGAMGAARHVPAASSTRVSSAPSFTTGDESEETKVISDERLGKKQKNE